MITAHIKKKLDGAGGKMFLDVQLSIEKGTFAILYGPSGAGKTSVLRILAGLMKADHGSIVTDRITWLDTKKRIDLAPQKRKIGYVFQEYALFPNMTVRENLEYALSKGQDARIIDELLQIAALENLQYKKPRELSGGQQQRIALARTLVQQPEIILMDEPLSALDISVRKKLQDYILKIHAKYQVTILMVSHDIQEVLKMADKVYCIKNGNIETEGNARIVLEEAGQRSMNPLQLQGEIIKISTYNTTYMVSVLIGLNIVEVEIENPFIKNFYLGKNISVNFEGSTPMIL